MLKRSVPLTVLVAIKNEARNLERCLASCAPAKHILVVDSGSTDGSAGMVKKAGGRLVQFRYKGGYPKKRQWALSSFLAREPWVFLLDADEEITPSLWNEIAAATAMDGPAAYLVTKQFHFMGRQFRFGGFSHKAICLIRPSLCRFEETCAESASGLDMEVHERVMVSGNIGILKNSLIHRDDKGLQSYLEKHNRYSTWEAEVRRSYEAFAGNANVVAPRFFGNHQERRRFFKHLAMRIPFESWAWFCWHYFLNLGFLEGRRGLYASLIRANYIMQVRAKMFESRSANAVPR